MSRLALFAESLVSPCYHSVRVEGTKGRNLGPSLKNKVYFLKHKLCENMTTEFAQEAESRINEFAPPEHRLAGKKSRLPC